MLKKKNFMWNIIYKNIKSVCCTPETNIVSQLYFNKKLFQKLKRGGINLNLELIFTSSLMTILEHIFQY